MNKMYFCFHINTLLTGVGGFAETNAVVLVQLRSVMCEVVMNDPDRKSGNHLSAKIEIRIFSL